MSRTVSSQSCGMQQISEVFTFVQERAVRYQAHGINKDHGDVNARITASSVTALSGLRWFNLADYSSVHPLIETSYPSGSWREVGASPGWLQARDRVHLGQAANPIHHRPKSAPFFFFILFFPWNLVTATPTSDFSNTFQFPLWSVIVLSSGFQLSILDRLAHAISFALPEKLSIHQEDLKALKDDWTFFGWLLKNKGLILKDLQMRLELWKTTAFRHRYYTLLSHLMLFSARSNTQFFSHFSNSHQLPSEPRGSMRRSKPFKDLHA